MTVYMPEADRNPVVVLDPEDDIPWDPDVMWDEDLEEAYEWDEVFEDEWVDLDD